MNKLIALLLGVVSAVALAEAPTKAPATAPSVKKVEGKAAFEKLKSLAGEWQGQAGHGAEKFPATVSYRLTGNGSAVVETLFPGTPHEMTTVYWMRGNDVVLTHYCAMGNQPHMKLDLAASTPNELKFVFDGGDNIDAAKDRHMHAVSFSFEGNTLKTDWASWADGKEADHAKFELKRAKAQTAPALSAQPASGKQ